MSKENTKAVDSPEVAALKEQLAAAQKQAATAETLKKQVSKLTNELKVAEAQKPKNAKPVVTIDGENYVVVAGERRNEKVGTAQELADNEARCRELIASGSGLLRKLNLKK
jgi:hypothetical protein